MSISKTSVRSWIAQTLQAYLKQYAELVTGFARKYRTDVFFRTGWNVVLLSLGFTAMLLTLVLVSLSVLHEDLLTKTVVDIIRSTPVGVPPVDSGSLLGEFEYVRERNMIVAGTVTLVFAAIFGWLIVRLALTPVRNALDSQKQFVGNIAHELRTPLAILKTNAEVALFDEKLGKDMREMIASNIEELDRISSIINNLLSMNRLLRPEKIEFKNIDLKDCIDSVLNTLADLIAHKKTVMEVRLSKESVIWGNASGIEQILMNIIKNAMHYSPHGSRIRISVIPTLNKEVILQIEDNGPGIEEKDLEHIFEPFYRGDTARNRKSGAGSGLGLAIVNELVKLHSGRIAMESTVGKGTTVIITFPAGRPENGGRPSA